MVRGQWVLCRGDESRKVRGQRGLGMGPCRGRGKSILAQTQPGEGWKGEVGRWQRPYRGRHAWVTGGKAIGAHRQRERVPSAGRAWVRRRNGYQDSLSRKQGAAVVGSVRSFVAQLMQGCMP